MSANKRLSRKQELAIQALLTERSLRDAARVAKTSEATLRRWRSDPVFSAAFKEARDSLLSHAITRLQSICGTAAAVIAATMVDKTASPSTRLAAAVKAFEVSIRGKEMIELETRISELEQKLAVTQSPLRKGL